MRALRRSTMPLLAGVLASQLAGFQAVAAPANAKLNGYWEIDDASRRANTERPELTALAQERAKAGAAAQEARLARGQVVGLGTYICAYNGFPFIVTTSEPFALVVTKDATLQITERPSMPTRRFYTDGRTLADVAKLPPNVNGWSVGRWEGEDLIVETRGLPPGGGFGGLQKGPESVFTERFHVEPDNQFLKVTYTVTDATLLKKPFSFTFTYARNPIGSTYAYGDFCDPNDDNGRTVKNPEEAK